MSVLNFLKHNILNLFLFIKHICFKAVYFNFMYKLTFILYLNTPVKR